MKFEPNARPDQVYVLAFDTMCTGWDCSKTYIQEEDGEWTPYIALYTKEEAEHEIQDCIETFGDCDDFIVHKDEYIHERKTIFTASGGKITGQKPEV